MKNWPNGWKYPGFSIRGCIRYFYQLKMVIGTSWFQRVLHKIFMKNVQILRWSTTCELWSTGTLEEYCKRRFLEIDQPETRIAYSPYLLTDQDKISNLYRGPSIGCFILGFCSFHQVVSKKILMWKVNGQQTTDAKRWQKITLPLASWGKNIDRGFNIP